MTSTTLYGLPNCDSCRNARKWLTAQGIAHDFVDYRQEPLPAATLQDWSAQVGGWKTLVNRSSTTWRNLPDPVKNPQTDDDWLALIAAQPTLVKRPVLQTPDGVVSVGFSEKSYNARFG